MFVAWYGSEVSGQAGAIEFAGAGAGGSAWQALDWIPLVLALTVAVALGGAGLRLAGSGWRAGGAEPARRSRCSAASRPC